MGIARRRRIRQSILTWVDANVQSNISNTKSTLDKLRELANEFESIDTSATCIGMFDASGAFGKDPVAEIQSLRHLEDISVFCGQKRFHKPWAQQWDRIRGVHTKMDPICDEQKVHAKQLPPSFMYSSMLKDVFFDMKFEDKHKNKMITMLLDKYSDNKKELSLINEFTKEYRPEKAIWWYTRQCFTFIEVDLGLRQLDASIIVDFDKQIQQLCEQQQASLGRRSLIVYREQGLIENEFKTLTKSKNGLLSFNCFLSTSKKQDISLRFAHGDTERRRHVGVLFAMHRIFKIEDIGKCPHDFRIYQVKLQLTDENDPTLVELKTHMANEYGGCVGHCLGRTLYLTCKPTIKQKRSILIYWRRKRMNETREDIITNWGSLKKNQGEYERALEYYQNIQEIQTRILPENHPNITTIYNCIGQVYDSVGKYSKSLDYYEKSLEIYKTTLPMNHFDIRTSYLNSGCFFQTMKEREQPVENLEEAKRIYTISLPPTPLRKDNIIVG